MVDLSSGTGLVYKITNPPGFGFVPFIRYSTVVDLRNPRHVPSAREALEFRRATPLEYLARWMDANELFNDNIRLTSVILWEDGAVSFSIAQPQYHGTPAHASEIEAWFGNAGWARIPDSAGHQVFYNYNWQVLALDVEPRNCYINEGLLLPFDVILCRPDEALSRHLGLYPG